LKLEVLLSIHLFFCDFFLNFLDPLNLRFVASSHAWLADLNEVLLLFLFLSLSLFLFVFEPFSLLDDGPVLLALFFLDLGCLCIDSILINLFGLLKLLKVLINALLDFIE
jgi:hypothetical protein